MEAGCILCGAAAAAGSPMNITQRNYTLLERIMMGGGGGGLLHQSPLFTKLTS